MGLWSSCWKLLSGGYFTGSALCTMGMIWCSKRAVKLSSWSYNAEWVLRIPRRLKRSWQRHFECRTLWVEFQIGGISHWVQTKTTSSIIRWVSSVAIPRRWRFGESLQVRVTVIASPCLISITRCCIQWKYTTSALPCSYSEFPLFNHRILVRYLAHSSLTRSTSRCCWSSGWYLRDQCWRGLQQMFHCTRCSWMSAPGECIERVEQWVFLGLVSLFL